MKILNGEWIKVLMKGEKPLYGFYGRRGEDNYKYTRFVDPLNGWPIFVYNAREKANPGKENMVVTDWNHVRTAYETLAQQFSEKAKNGKLSGVVAARKAQFLNALINYVEEGGSPFDVDCHGFSSKTGLFVVRGKYIIDGDSEKENFRFYQAVESPGSDERGLDSLLGEKFGSGFRQGFASIRKSLPHPNSHLCSYLIFEAPETVVDIVRNDSNLFYCKSISGKKSQLQQADQLS